MVECVLAFSILLLGYSNVRILVRGHALALSLCLAFPVGLMVYVLLSSFVLILRLPYTIPFLAGICGIEMIAAYIFGLKVNEKAINLRDELSALGLLCLASLIALLPNASVLSYDSFAQINLGRAIVTAGGIQDQHVGGQLFSWGISLPAMQSLATLAGGEYFHSLSLFVLVSYFAVFIYAMRDASSGKGKNAYKTAILFSMALFSTYFLAFQGFYIHNNFLASLFLFMFAICFWLHERTEGRGFILLGTAFLLVFALTRLENMLVGLVFLVPLLSRNQYNSRERLAISMGYGLPLIAWYGRLDYLGFVSNSGTDIADPWKILMMLTAVAMLMLVMAFSSWRRGGKLLKYLPRCLAAFIALGVVSVAAISPGNTLESLKNLAANAFLMKGNWGIFWYAALALGILASRRDPNDSLKSFTTSIALAIGLLFFFVSFRAPFRLGWGDSGNRILTHFAPLLVFVLAIGFAKRIEEWSRTLTVIGIALFLFFVGLFLLEFVLYWTFDGDRTSLVGWLLAKARKVSRSVWTAILGGGLCLLVALGHRVLKLSGAWASVAVAGILLSYNLATFPFINANGPFAIRFQSDNTLLSAISDVELGKTGYDRAPLQKVKRALGGRVVKTLDYNSIPLLNVLGERFFYPSDKEQPEHAPLPGQAGSLTPIGPKMSVLIDAADPGEDFFLVRQEDGIDGKVFHFFVSSND